MIILEAIQTFFTLLIFVGIPLFLIVLMFLVTVNQVYRKGHSAFLALGIALFLPVIGLLAAMIMPYDQELLAERRARQEEKALNDKEYFVRIQRQQHLKPIQPMTTLADEPLIYTRIQTICVSFLLPSLIIPAFQPPEIISIVLGMVSIFSLIGLMAAMLIPLGHRV